MAAVQVSTLFWGTPPTPVYIFFSVIEVALLVAVAIFAAVWTRSAEYVEQRPALAPV